MKYIEVDKERARIDYPEIFDIHPPHAPDAAYDLFESLEDKPDGFYQEDGWCEMFETETGNRFAVYGEGELTNSTNLYIIKNV